MRLQPALLSDPRYALHHPWLAHECLVQLRRHARYDATVVAPRTFAKIYSVSIGFPVGGRRGGGGAPKVFGGVGEEIR
jgi:hypothetical protein